MGGPFPFTSGSPLRLSYVSLEQSPRRSKVWFINPNKPYWSRCTRCSVRLSFASAMRTCRRSRLQRPLTRADGSLCPVATRSTSTDRSSSEKHPCSPRSEVVVLDVSVPMPTVSTAPPFIFGPFFRVSGHPDQCRSPTRSADAADPQDCTVGQREHVCTAEARNREAHTPLARPSNDS